MFLRSKKLSEYSEIIHGFTTRQLGSDYDRVGAEIGVPASSFRTLNQIHSNKVVVIPKSPPTPLFQRGEGGISPDGDALITNIPGIFVGIRTADCVPILVFDPIKKVMAAIHAGWKGILVGIIENSVREMREIFGSDPSTLIVAVGPTLCPGCFEIGPEVADQFREKFKDRLIITSDPLTLPSPLRGEGEGEGDRGGFKMSSRYLDLKKAVEIILTDQGVLLKNIEFYPQCNKCREDLFFSFRRGDEKERQLSFIGLTRT